MPLIIDVALPNLDLGGAISLCLALENALASRLDTRQLTYIKSFALREPAIRARLSRLLARAAALRFLPSGAKIQSNDRRLFSLPAGGSLSFSHPAHRAFVALHEDGVAAVDSEMIDAATLPAIASLALKYSPKASIASGLHILRVWTIFETAVKLLGESETASIAKNVFGSELKELKWRGKTRVAGRDLRWISFKKDKYIVTLGAFSDLPNLAPKFVSLDWRELKRDL